MAVHGFALLYLLGRIAWLGVVSEQAEAAMRGLLRDLLGGMQRMERESPEDFHVMAKPIPSLVFDELGLTAEDFSPGTVEVFDSNQPWPVLSIGPKNEQ